MENNSTSKKIEDCINTLKDNLDLNEIEVKEFKKILNMDGTQKVGDEIKDDL